MGYKLGIDIGSTTLKTVILDHEDKVIQKSYQRHFSKVREATLEQVKSLEPILGGQEIKVAITGSAGLGIAKSGGLEFVQEVFATAGAVSRVIPRTDVVIELGGEDAKIIFLKGTIEERMNGTCAGGTGAFIDQMATLLNVTPDELDVLSRNHKKIYPIASRCGVFAKSDIQPLLNQGANKEDIAASIFQAVVDQTITGLAQGRKIEGNVLFLGGPLSFLKGLQERFVKTLKLEEPQAIFPSLAPYFVALGSAYYADTIKNENTLAFEELVEKLEATSQEISEVNTLPPLFASDEEYEEFSERHLKMQLVDKNLTVYSGDAYLGVDAGSTTTKLVLIDREGNILYRYYNSNGGNPVPIVRKQLEEIYRLAGDKVTIRGSAATGYGEDLMSSAFRMDHGLVETVAHYTAAKHFDPDVDFIIDIGGQDIKCFHIKDGTVDNVILNEACSSGCGSFIETFAKGLGYNVRDFAKLAVKSRRPVDLGSRCTVFMNSSVKQAQKDGAMVEDISAGLAISVIKNAIYKVIRARSPEDLGRHVVVQGGTFLNDAVLRSFEQEMGREVVRLSIAELMGAYGAALYAMENSEGESSLITPRELADFVHTSTVTTCKKCTNRCSLTINTFGDGRRFISGNKCERGAEQKVNEELPNLYLDKYKLLMSMHGGENHRGRVGIPMVLNMLENIPFWYEFFTSLDCEVVLSAQSSRKLYMKGQQTIPSDTVCYPAKLAHGHIEDLIDKGVDMIFYPCMTYNFEEGSTDNCYNCPVVAYYPELLQSNISRLEEVDFVYPHISLNNKPFFVKRIFKELEPYIPNLKKKEIQIATDRAYEAYARFRRRMEEMGEKALEYARDNGKMVIVLAGRPYHVDPEINHGIDKLLSSLDFVVITEDSISDLVEPIGVNVLNQWTYHARMYNAAAYVADQEHMELVQLVSFGCGIDAITADEVSDILRQNGKLYTQLKIDEINNLGAVKIRLRSLLAAMNERERRKSV